MLVLFAHLVVLSLKISAGSTVTLVLFLVYRWIRRDRTLDSVPGPKSWPLLANYPMGPPRHTADILRRFTREYGEIFKFQLGWYNWVAINSPEAMKELFDRQVRSLTSYSASLMVSIIASSKNGLTLRYSQILHHQKSPCQSQMASLPEGCACSPCHTDTSGVPTVSSFTNCSPQR